MWNKIKRYIPTRRKIIQLYCAVLFNANLKGFVSGRIFQGDTKRFCAPGINCYSCPGAVGACPLGSMQGTFNAANHTTIYYVFGILFLYGILFGRMICGWMCPFGLIQELLYKIRTPKAKKSKLTRYLSWLKYVILVVFAFLIPIAYAFRHKSVPAFCKFICPAGTIEGGLLLLSNKVNESYFSMLGPIFTWKFLLMVSIVVGCVFVFRLFCRFICPLGALYGLFNRFSFFGIQVDNSKCVGCSLCIRQCKMDIRHVGDAECISCGECVSVCPTQAISFKGSGVFLRKNDIPQENAANTQRLRNLTRGIVAVVMAAVLIGAVVYFWNQEAPEAPVTNQTSNIENVDVGNQVGNLCYRYGLQVLSGSDSETFDPVATGKVTLINFWGTWCASCVEELPYFDRVAREYGEDITVVTVHSYMLGETAPDFIRATYPDSPMVFTLDYSLEGSDISGYYTSLGGRGTYPYTVVLDERGVITKIFFSSVTYEDLKAAVEDALTQ